MQKLNLLPHLVKLSPKLFLDVRRQPFLLSTGPYATLHSMLLVSRTSILGEYICTVTKSSFGSAFSVNALQSVRSSCMIVLLVTVASSSKINNILPNCEMLQMLPLLYNVCGVRNALTCVRCYHCL